MAYQYVREPLTGEEADRLANTCETPEEKLVVWTLLDTGLRVHELSAFRPDNIAWQRELRVKGKGGPNGKRSKQRAVPVGAGVRALLESYFAYRNEWLIGGRQAQRLQHTFATLALQKGISLVAVRGFSATTG